MSDKHRFTVENLNTKNRCLKYSGPFCIASKMIVALSSLYNSSLMASRFSSPLVVGSLTLEYMSPPHLISTLEYM